VQDTPDLHIGAIESIETAIAHLADALAHLDRMPASDRQSISFAAHVMNNYLSVADAALNLLSDALQGHPNPEVGTWIDSLQHLGHLMSHAMGRFSEGPSASELPLKFDAVDLSRLMLRACEYYRMAAAQKGLTVSCRPGTDVPLAFGDRVAIAVVADNLLSNAVKYSKPGGSVQVEVVPGPGGVACRVCDSGPGLSASEQARLFQPGARVGPSPTAGEPSAGFGLVIVKQLVERMGGRVWVESEPGQGACFSFRIPYLPAEPARS
jgi:signal transduction histidine kinase